MNNNFVKIKFKDLPESDSPWSVESLWASISDNNSYRIENIPFYAKNFALHDIVSVTKDKSDLYIQDLLEESGNSTIHIVFFDKKIVQETREKLKDMGCTSELSNIPTLIAVNIPPTVDYNGIIKTYLEKGAKSDWWDYQEACLAQ